MSFGRRNSGLATQSEVSCANLGHPASMAEKTQVAAPRLGRLGDQG
jgi:hypothetical protein